MPVLHLKEKEIFRRQKMFFNSVWQVNQELATPVTSLYIQKMDRKPSLPDATHFFPSN